MIRLGSSWYNWIYWSNFETLSDYKSSAMPHLYIIRLACTKTNSYSDFLTLPPSLPPSLWRSCVVSCINKFGGTLLVVPCVAPFWHCLCLAILFLCLNFVRSSSCGTGEIRKAQPILFSYLTIGKKVRYILFHSTLLRWIVKCAKKKIFPSWTRICVSQLLVGHDVHYSFGQNLRQCG